MRDWEENYKKSISILRPQGSLVGPYVRSDKRTEHKCECGRIFLVTPAQFKRGKTCGICSGLGTLASRNEAIRKMALADAKPVICLIKNPEQERFGYF